MNYEVLTLRNVGISHGRHEILVNLNLSLHMGQNLGVVITNDFEATVFIELLTGERQANSGLFMINDKQIKLKSRSDAARNGIVCLRRKSQLIYKLSVEENIFLTSEVAYVHGFLNKKLTHTLCLDLFRQFGINNLSPSIQVSLLDDFSRLYIELIKLYTQNPQIIVVETPALDYNKKQLDLLKLFFENCTRKGIACVCTSNKHLKILENCDKICLLQRGSIIYIFDSGKETPEILRRVLYDYYNRAAHTPERLDTKPLVENPAASIFFKCYFESGALELHISGGEVVGICDGQHHKINELRKILDDEVESGSFFLIDENKILLSSRSDCGKNGIFIVDDPTRENPVFYNLSLYENVALMLDSKSYMHQGILSDSTDRFAADWALSKIWAEDIKEKCSGYETTPNMTRHVQMKIFVARILCAAPKLVIFINPFDIYNDTSIDDFLHIIDVLKSLGVGVIIWSFSRKQLMSVTDRVISLLE